MTELLYLQEVFERLRMGHHLSSEDGPAFSDMVDNYDSYANYFSPLGLTLVRHPREFFYFEPKATENAPEGLARIAVFSFILIDHAANIGKPVEEYLFTTTFLVSQLPHFSLDRYTALLRQFPVEDKAGLRQIVKRMEGLGWAKFLDDEAFKFRRPFYRMLEKCLELSAGTTDRREEARSTKGSDADVSR